MRIVPRPWWAPFHYRAVLRARGIRWRLAGRPTVTITTAMMTVAEPIQVRNCRLVLLRSNIEYGGEVALDLTESVNSRVDSCVIREHIPPWRPVR